MLCVSIVWRSPKWKGWTMKHMNVLAKGSLPISADDSISTKDGCDILPSGDRKECRKAVKTNGVYNP